MTEQECANLYEESHVFGRGAYMYERAYDQLFKKKADIPVWKSETSQNGE